MRVNSAFTGFFTHRLVVGMVMLAILFIASSFTTDSDRDLRAKQANLIMRQIGHRLLLQAGDSTSRVLPVTESKEGTFLLTFENDFVFNHDSLMMLTQSSFPKTQFPSGYTVTVHECTNASIVYGFQINHAAPNILACRGRSQPPGCYTIEIAFPDLYEKVEQKKADIGQPTELKSAKVGPRETNPKLEEFTSVKVDPQETNPKLEEFKWTTFDYRLISLVSSGMLVFLSVAFLVGRFGKRLVPVPVPVPVPVQNQDHFIINESVP